jgi:TRAP-type mannitol/chloroaromatic compound transport system permease large subunit
MPSSDLSKDILYRNFSIREDDASGGRAFYPHLILFFIDGDPFKLLFNIALEFVAEEISSFWANWILLPIPLFILMGELLYIAGSGSDIFNMASKWFQGLPGGLAVVTMRHVLSLPA